MNFATPYETKWKNWICANVEIITVGDGVISVLTQNIFNQTIFISEKRFFVVIDKNKNYIGKFVSLIKSPDIYLNKCFCRYRTND